MKSIALAALVVVGSFSNTSELDIAKSDKFPVVPLVAKPVPTTVLAGSLISDSFEILLAPEVVLPTDKPDEPDEKKPQTEPRRVLNVCEASGGRKIIVNHGRNWQCVYHR